MLCKNLVQHTGPGMHTGPFLTFVMQVHVSYLEIYNETGFDLLDPNREVKAMEDLPQVQDWALSLSCSAKKPFASSE